MITCECGYQPRGTTEEDEVADAQRHAREVHGIEVTREQVLATARGEVA